MSLIRAAAAVAVVWASSAAAFCGFYVSGGGAQLFNDASMVVLVRDETRTVLSMQNNYRGPADDFALVVPVPVLLSKENVQTIPREAFTRIDQLTAPRLVEQPQSDCLGRMGSGSGGFGTGIASLSDGMPRDLGVKVEARFEVEEYEIVILSAKFSLGLEIWLKENKYQIPPGAAAALQPYVQTGMKFFVAKVNSKKAKFVDGQVVLSPLRFFYDSEQFSLPVRLGLLNSSGTQDLIVIVVAKSRYELANAPNVLVPTNVDVRTRAQPQFGAFYKELLGRTFAKHPKAAVTEFAWQGALPPPTELVGGGIYGVTCDPCPPPHPVDNPLGRYLGVNHLPKIKTNDGIAAFAQAATVTRLHLRYSKDSAPDDLVFKAVDPIAGGVPGVKAGPAKTNRFQGRYVMWVEGCGSGGFFGSAPPAMPSTPTTTSLIDPFEQIIVNDLPELGVKAQPLSKDAKPLPYQGPAEQTMITAPPARGTVKVEKPTVPAGYDGESVRRVLLRSVGQLRYCYESSLRGNPSLTGKVVLTLTLDAEGKTQKFSVSPASSLKDAQLENCLLGRARTWVFPAPPEGRSVTMNLPLLFAPPQ